MGKCPFNPATIRTLIPTTLAISSYNLEEVEKCANHVFVTGENRRNPPGNHKRRGYCCFWSTFKVACHLHLAAVLDFGDTKNGRLFFVNPYASKHKIKSKIAFNRHIARKIDSVLH